jgi:lipopolysaccharide export system protein LptC
MAGYDNSYSRFVFWLKILLPLAAMAILSTMFLIAHTIDPLRAIPFSKVDVKELARDSRISAPDYAGVMSDGAAISIKAASAQPDLAKPGRATAQTVAATLTAVNGGVTRMAAASGVMDQSANLLTLKGNVTVDTSTGYHVTADSLSAALDRTRVDAVGNVSATAPMGTITAGSMTMTPDPATQGDYVLVFNKDVKLVYEPGN